MSKSIRFFGEGKADEKFLRDFVKHHFNIEEIDYVDVKGKDSIHLVKNKFIMNTDQGGINLLIFDADNDFQAALDNVQKQKNECGVEFEIFLFPNNTDIGALEELLIRLTVPEHQSIFECFKPFNKCLNASGKGYNVPDLKTQVYSYLSFQKLEAKEEKRDYTLDCWDLDAEYGESLKEFIAKYI
ncbi:hypothetical protein DVK85_12455 [Flavobacterium arcticum]|uniref:DUF4276 family protein n=1 Tax=Flavobacterium arcticum TaxID=1784713 RepID=A0A345HEI7_9FLAO|nr:DUF3226 domain-containing protein [Flavobacterium arcticum]AXG74997.1 hypothetical protein DVK85_12455 [Flavobacterium arcticum]KAF2506550.1 hypothetical protein E0W72_13030 [Flavobacterium arcticum]